MSLKMKQLREVFAELDAKFGPANVDTMDLLIQIREVSEKALSEAKEMDGVFESFPETITYTPTSTGTVSLLSATHHRGHLYLGEVVIAGEPLPEEEEE